MQLKQHIFVTDLCLRPLGTISRCLDDIGASGGWRTPSRVSTQKPLHQHCRRGRDVALEVDDRGEVWAKTSK